MLSAGVAGVAGVAGDDAGESAEEAAAGSVVAVMPKRERSNCVAKARHAVCFNIG